MMSPGLSRLAGSYVQSMSYTQRIGFMNAMRGCDKLSDVPQPYRRKLIAYGKSNPSFLWDAVVRIQ